MKTVDVKTIRAHIRQCRAEIVDLKKERRESVRLTKEEYKRMYASHTPSWVRARANEEIRYATDLYDDVIELQRAKIEALQELLKETV